MLIENMAPEKVFTICEYAGTDGDVPDPYGGDLEEYEEIADEIYDLLTDIAEKLWEEK
jgi:protein-tyrosine phosphatase